MRALVLGGYGNFGARIVRALSGQPGLEVLVGGRDPARGIVIDHTAADFGERLRSLDVDLLIHTAGPFQQQAYDVARAAVAAGVHYVDLADGRRFVCDFAAAVDALAVEQGVAAITGASSVPALSAAVVDHLTQGWRRVVSIETCIAPAQTAPRGRATLAGVLAYCGEPVRVWQDSRWTVQTGWADLVKIRFARLAPRWGALCDVPDLELFVERYPGIESVMFRAALELGIGQRVFALLAQLRAMRLIPSPSRFAAMLDTAGKPFDRFGSSVGGMVVRVRGIDSNGLPVARAWHVTAPDNHGPEIPVMAAVVLARRLARGETWRPGARPCMGLVALAEFDESFAHWNMTTDIVDETWLPTGPE